MFRNDKHSLVSKRRSFLKMVGTAGLAGLAGCGGDSGSGDGGGGGDSGGESGGSDGSDGVAAYARSAGTRAVGVQEIGRDRPDARVREVAEDERPDRRADRGVTLG